MFRVSCFAFRVRVEKREAEAAESSGTANFTGCWNALGVYPSRQTDLSRAQPKDGCGRPIATPRGRRLQRGTRDLDVSFTLTLTCYVAT